MHQDNLNLFKQAIAEGLSNKIARTESGYTGEVVCSDRHIVAMRTIVYGKAEKRKKLSTKTKILIAILVAAALILTSCGIIFRNEFKIMFEELYVAIVPSDRGANNKIIEEVYRPSYLPEDYFIKESIVLRNVVFYSYFNSEGEELTFYQAPFNSSAHVYDTENSNTSIIQISGFTVYYTVAPKSDYYLWNDTKYSYEISTSERLSVEEIENIINGLVCE